MTPGDDLPSDPAPPPVAVPADAARGWLRQGARVLRFAKLRWPQGEPQPAAVAALVLANYAVALVVQRGLTTGSPSFRWDGLLAGWLGVAVVAWLCWVVARSDSTATVKPGPLFAVWAGSALVLNLIVGAGLLALRPVVGTAEVWPTALFWTAWLAPLGWAGLAQITFFWRAASSGLARAVVVLVVPATLAVSGSLAPVMFWWPEPPDSTAAEPDADVADTSLPLTDDTIAQQAHLLEAALASLRAPQPDRINVYAATFAPNASEDVFMRESAVVAQTMREHFGANGRLVELVANRATTDTLPWGTPANLRRTLQRMAAVMDRERDVLFVHLTSHGGADGKLANDTWPLQTEPMTPDLLKRWLDAAGVRWRVISVSACYSGSWIKPLAGDGTLVMTAADAEHTSYGCGKRSPLTFFGRAMYEEELRRTRSFTEAHAAARKVIEMREQEAGKTDGYSNPQISVGAGIAEVLRRLEGELGGR